MAKETEKQPKEKQPKDTTASAAPDKVAAVAPKVSAKGRDFVMKRGQILLAADDLRRPGDIVKRSELTPEEAEKFLARGTIAIQGA